MIKFYFTENVKTSITERSFSKKIIPIFIIILCCFTSLGINAQNIAFTDANFKELLLNSSDIFNSTQPYHVAQDSNGNFIAIDKNGDREIQESEALDVYKLKISEPNISSLTGLEKFTNLNEIFISTSPITSIDLTSNVNLKSITCYLMPQLTNLNISGLIKIENFDNYFGTNLNTKINQLDFSSSPNLNMNLVFISNVNHLNLKNGTYILAGNNSGALFTDSINYICCDDGEELAYVNGTINYLQSTNCNVNTYCSFIPGGNYNTITGKVRFDENNNGCDTNDDFFEHMKLKINDGTNTSETFVKADGTYNFYTQGGNFTISIEPENATLFSANPISFSANFADNNNNVFSQDVCVSKTNNSQDLEVVIAPITNARPGFPATYKLIWKNKGNTNLSGTVSLNFEGNKMSFNSSSIPYSSIDTNSISYSFSNLKPYESKASEIDFTINPPTHVTNPINLNDVLTFTANGNIIGNDILPDDNIFSLKQTVVGSYDPNDIVCLEGDLVTEEKIGDYFHYIVNFENTGTSEAENIVVEMDIDTDDFDISTLQLQNATGEVYTRISGNKAEFIFKKINLGSGEHGNVLFKVKSKSTLTKNDVIINRANIYFDYNFPVKTNDAITQFQQFLKNQEIKHKDNIIVFPIPAKDYLNISSENNIKSIEIYDENGRILQTIKGNANIKKINITKLEKGIYYLFIKTNDGVKTKKFIKE